MRSIVLSALFCACATSGAAAQWHLEAGRATIHEHAASGPVGLVGYGRSFEGGVARLGGIAMLGGADDGFLALQLNAELHLAPGRRLSPFFSVRPGFLIEPEFSGAAASAVLGAVLRPGPGLGVRLGAGWSSHGGEPGPNFVTVGLQLGGS